MANLLALADFVEFQVCSDQWDLDADVGPYWPQDGTPGNALVWTATPGPGGG